MLDALGLALGAIAILSEWNRSPLRSAPIAEANNPRQP
jgi:hypothetical protein